MARFLTEERRNKIAESIIANGSIKVNDLIEQFSVSKETIRKDLIYLEQSGIIKKSRGGALSVLERMERPLKDRAMEAPQQKQAIAEYAATLVRDDAVIFIDSGSTNLCLAKLLYLRKNLTIFTNSLSVANILVESENQVYMCGGLLNATTMSLVGFGATSFLEKLRMDFAFLGSSGFHGHHGPTSIDFTDAEVKKTVTRNTRTNIVLAHSAKVRSTAIIEYADWKNIDCLITDSALRGKEEQELSKFVKIYKVEVP